MALIPLNHRANTAQYDFSVFLTAPAVRDLARPYGRPQIVNIPEHRAPSPLAPNISPHTVKDLKDWLVGDGTGRGAYKGQRGGKEIWESWKRAWDLWNNHYIEGRVAPVWIRAEYERIRKEMEVARDERRRRRPFGGLRGGRRGHPGRQRQGRIVIAAEQPKADPGMVFEKTATKIPIEPTIVKKSRPTPGREPKLFRKGQEAPIYEDKPVPMEIVKMQRAVCIGTLEPTSDWTEVARNRQAGKAPIQKAENAALEETRTTMETKWEARQVMHYTHVDIEGDEMIEPNKLMSYEALRKARANGQKPTQKDEDSNPTNKTQPPMIWVPVKEPYQTGTRTLTQDETILVVHYEDIDVEVLEEKFEWREVPATLQPVVDDDGDQQMDLDPVDLGDVSLAPTLDDDEEPEILIPAAWRTINAAGGSGGFLPMKLLDEYLEPVYNDETVFPEWIDALQNCVWRPRRVGEKTLKIDMDERFEDFFENTELEVDGGVDCGRSPYPVMRSITEYYKRSSTNPHDTQFRKLKVWDKVTGTIFNMPTKPLEDDCESEDERVARMNALYSDVYRDYRGKCRHDFFPLDIRRVKRINDDFPRAPVLSQIQLPDEKLIRYPWHDPPRNDNAVNEYDPWFVTPEQRMARDQPPRKYPPIQCYKETETGEDARKTLLPVIEDQWWEEIQDDDYGRNRYFVTNLHGGTLLVNGQEVKKGCIAGPLPPFAIIQTPGGQVSFWWGVTGRNWGEGPAGQNHSSAWKTLRMKEGWNNVGLIAGQVWDFKIRERVTREFTGNEYDDDIEWEEWKRAVPAVEAEIEPIAKVSDKPDEPIVLQRDVTGLPLVTDIVQPECFESAEAELKWLHTKAEPLKSAIEIAKAVPLIEPTPDSGSFWPGVTEVQPETIEVTLQKAARQGWDRNKSFILAAQRRIARDTNVLLQRRVDEHHAADVALGRKRKADADLEIPSPKRTIQTLERERKEAEVAAKKVKEAGSLEKQKKKDAAALRLRVLEFDAAIAAAKYNLSAGSNEDDVIKQHVQLEEARAQKLADSVATLNADRVAHGKSKLPDITSQPSIRDIYAAWLTFKVNQGDDQAEKLRQERLQKEDAKRLAANKKAEAERLERARLTADEAAKRKVREDLLLSNMSQGQKNLQERLGMMRAKAAAAADKRANDEKMSQDEKGRLSNLQGQLNTNQQDSALDSQHVKAKNNFTEFITNNALAAGVSEDEYMKIVFKHTDRDLAFAQQNSLLSTTNLLPPPETEISLATTIVVPPPGKGNQATTALIRKRGKPDDRKWPAVLKPSVLEFRTSLQNCIRENLAARAILEGKTELEIVREAGYFDVQGYIFNQSSYLGEDGPFGIKVEELYEIVPDNVRLDGLTDLVKTQAETRNTISDGQKLEVRKRIAWALKIERLEDWELQARAGEMTRPPPTVDISDVCYLARADVNGPPNCCSHRIV